MARSFRSLSLRAQMVLFAMVCLLVIAGAWQVVLGPAQAEIGSALARLRALDGEVRQARRVASRLLAVQGELQQLEQELLQAEAVISEEKDPQDVLRNLSQLASDSLLDIASFTPKPVVVRAQYAEWPIELGLEGTYHDLGRFLGRIAAMPQLMSVSDLQIATQPPANGRGSVSVSCVATTFVFQNDVSPFAADQP